MRKSTGKRLRFEIFARDNFTCRYCGHQSDTVKLVVDHVQPVCQGGTSDPENLITSCETCNQGKAGKTIAQVVPTESDRLRLAQERNEQIASYENAIASIEAREGLRGLLTDFWIKKTGRSSVDSGTLYVVFKYVEEFGIDTVLRWIEKAVARVGRNDRTIGKYVSGIRRKHLADIAELEAQKN